MPTSSIEKISSNIFSKLLLLTNSLRRAGVPFERIASLKSFSDWNRKNTRTISLKLNKNFEENRIR